MKSELVVVGDRVLILPDEGKDQTDTGLYLPHEISSGEHPYPPPAKYVRHHLRKADFSVGRIPVFCQHPLQNGGSRNGLPLF